MQITAGTRLAHYEIIALLGRGGMGEVWRATDTKLGRDVAIKVLPEEFTRDSERLSRFEREARVLASLEHSQIASIHGFEEVDGFRFLVMQLAEGEDLSERLTRGPLPIDEAIKIASGIADALESAHEKGIIHRDLKPANIKVDEGRVMVLDFGLAKALEAESGDADLSNSPTMVRAASHTGVILGTAPYMSPEQARGKRVDRRADIWSFGVVLYEMLTGRRLFSGETVSDTLALVLTREVDFSALPDKTPAHVKWLLERCLDRDPKLRLRDIGEARVCLDTSGSFALDTGSGHSRASGIRPMVVAAALLLGLLIGVTVMMFLRPGPKPDPIRKVDIQLAGGNAFGLGPLISPDGYSVTLPSEDGLFVRRLDEVDPKLLPGTKELLYTCWSPDSREIAFVARGRLWRVPTDGRAPVALATLPEDLLGGGGMVWLPDDRILLAGSSSAGLMEVSARGGAPVELVPLDLEKDRDFHEVSALPDGRGLLVSVHPEGGVPDRIDLIVDGERKNLLTTLDGWLENPIYSPTGHLLYSLGSVTPDLWAVSFSLETLELSGQPFLVASESMFPSISNDGTLSYVRGSRSVSRQLLRVDRTGRIERELARPAPDCTFPDVSPDGKRIAASVVEGATYDVMVFDTETRTTTRMTTGAGVDLMASWSPDGRLIVYEITDQDIIALLSLDRPGEPTNLTDGSEPRWWPDGKSIALYRLGPDRSWDLWRYWIEEDRAEVLLATGANEKMPNPSPDGRLVAYVSDETGRDEVYVYEPGVVGSKVQVSIDGASPQARWSPDGAELYFRQGDTLMSARRLEGDRLNFGEPERLFSLSEAGLTVREMPWAVAPDGNGFVVLRDVATGENEPILTLVTNWASEFEVRP